MGRVTPNIHTLPLLGNQALTQVLVSSATNSQPDNAVGVTDQPFQGNIHEESPNHVVQINSQNPVSIPSSTAFQDNATLNTSKTRTTPIRYGPAPVENNSIEDFLRKPAIIHQALITDMVAAGTIFNLGSIGTLLQTNQLWADKISGYRMVRADAVVRLVLNANPFQQGRLILFCLPCASDFEAYNNAFTFMHTYSICAMTQLPNVEVDFGDTSAELTIPYISPSNYYDLGENGFDWGSVYLGILSPLRTGSNGEDSAEVTVFLHFENVELAAPIVPEAASSNVRPRGKRFKRKVQGNMLGDEEQIASSGVVETIANVVTDTADALSSIPAIGSFMSGVGNIAETVGSVASIFGWSKPTTIGTIEQYALAPFRYLNNAVGVGNADTFSITPNAMLEPYEKVFGTNVDEMSFEFLKQIPAYVDRFTWSTSDSSGSTLYSFPVSTFFVEQQSPTINGKVCTIRTAPPAFHLATLFKFWRGSINLTFKFVKTANHSGRIQIIYVPHGGTLSNVTLTQYLLRDITDVRSVDEVTVNIPYLHQLHWLYTHEWSTSAEDTALGEIYIINQGILRAPEIASDTIEVLVYASGGPDFELAVPAPTQNVPFSPEDLTTEASSSAIFDTALTTKGIGNAEIVSKQGEYNSSSIGDHFTSVKQLMQMARKFFITATNLPATAGTILPSSVGTFVSLGNSVPQTAGLWGDYISFLTPGYVFCRGGYRLTNASTNNTAATQVGVFPSEDITTLASNSAVGNVTTTIGNGVPLTTYQTTPFMPRHQLNGQLDVVAPHFGRTPIRLNYLSDTSTTTPPNKRDSHNWVVTYNASTNLDGYWMRSGADDFSMGYFVGFGPLLVAYADP